MQMTNSADINLYLAFEESEIEAVLRAAALVGNLGCGLKIGISAFTALGPEKISGLGAPLFLDLKFHDIPSVVENAVARAVKLCRPRLLTVHGSGGEAMLRAAKRAAAQSETKLLAVTVLTSLPADIETSKTLAKRAKRAGIDGIVCSAVEAGQLRKVIGEEMLIVSPGIRVDGASAGDQKRIATPTQAGENGVDCIVAGRGVFAAAEPAAAAENILKEFIVGKQNRLKNLRNKPPRNSKSAGTAG